MAARTPTPRSELKLRLRLDVAGRGTVTIRNVGASDLLIWRPGNSWGDEALRFETEGPTGERSMLRKSQDYTRNVPATETIAPAGALERHFDLHDGTWTSGPSRGDARTLRAVFEIPDSEDARIHGVWTGCVLSRRVPWVTAGRND
jgi:hypothetical protein